MAMIPDSTRDGLAYSESEPDAQRRHNEQMKKFRLAHPRLETKVPRVARPEGRLAFVPVPLVEPGRYFQN